MARRSQFASHAEPDEIAYLQRADAEGRLTLIKGQHTLADGVELIEVGGHTPGQVIVSVATGRTSTRRWNATARSPSWPTCPPCTGPMTCWPTWRPSQAPG
jgi:hypothetical protein